MAKRSPLIEPILAKIEAAVAPLSLWSIADGHNVHLSASGVNLLPADYVEPKARLPQPRDCLTLKRGHSQ